MDEAVRSLVMLSAALAAGDDAGLDAAIDRAAAAAPGAAEEALVQSYLFLGYPAALNGLRRWRERTGLPAPAASDEDPAEWRARGAAVCARVYGGQYVRLRANVARLHPDLERWMVEEGYGKVLGRPGLELKVRELCIVALLVPQEAGPQLYAHLRGALHAGATQAEVEEALAVACAAVPEGRARVAREVWSAVRRRRGGGNEDRTGSGDDVR